MRISDWSSDVCSSDLNLALGHRGGQRTGVDVDDARTRVRFLGADRKLPAEPAARRSAHRLQRQREQARGELFPCRDDDVIFGGESGRASCRERVCQYVCISVVAESLKKKKKEKL